MVTAYLVGLTQGGRLLTVPLIYDAVLALFSTRELNERMVFSDLYVNGERCYTTRFKDIEKYLFHNDLSVNLLNATDYRNMGEMFTFGLASVSRTQCCTIASRVISSTDLGGSLQPWNAVNDINTNTIRNLDDYNVDDGGLIWSIGGVTSNSEPSVIRMDYPNGTYNLYEFPPVQIGLPNITGWRFVGKWDGQPIRFTAYRSTGEWYGIRINASVDPYVREFVWTLDGASPASRSLSMQFQLGNPQ